MDHSYFTERISAYYDNCLSPYETEVVKAHLEECDECRALLTRYEKLDKVVEENSKFGNEDYWEKSARKIESALEENNQTFGEERSGIVTKMGAWKYVAAAASIAVLTFVSVYKDEILNRGNDLPSGSILYDMRPESEPERALDDESRGRADEPASIPLKLKEQLVDEKTGVSAGKESNAETKTVPEADKRDETGSAEALEIGGDNYRPKKRKRPELRPSPVQSEDALAKDKRNYLGKEEVLEPIVKNKKSLQTGLVGETILSEQSARSKSPEYADAVLRNDLDHWRKVRRRNLTNRSALSRVHSASDFAPTEESGTTKRSSKKYTFGMRIADSLLIYASYRVVSLSTDSTEVAQSRKTIEKFAADSTAFHQRYARDLLDSLGRESVD